MADSTVQTNSRRMKFPYTFGAQVAQFPYKLYIEKSWLLKWYIFGVLASYPIFYKIQKLSMSPENKKKWAEIRRKMYSPEGH